MAVEARRGCGYRKAGGTYLVGGGIGVPCDRLPFELEICPCCSAGIKPALGWTWIKPGLLFQGLHLKSHFDGMFTESKLCECKEGCWLCTTPGKFEKAGLLWIGGSFYPSPAKFLREGLAMGLSRRIKAIPRGFKIGTPVFLAHRKTIERPVMPEDVELNPKLKGGLIASFPGIFYAWIPERIEKIFNESEHGSEAVQDAEKHDITPVFVPDNDPDHHGTVYDKEKDEE